LQILDILAKDSLTPFVETAKKIGVSDATVQTELMTALKTNK